MSLVTGRHPTKGFLARISDGSVRAIYPFQFNPTEVGRSMGVEWALDSPPGSALPHARFQASKGSSITLQLLLDAVEDFSSGGRGGRHDRSSEGVLPQQAALEALVSPDFDQFINSDLGAFIAPPQVRYGMGGQSWEVVVQTLNFRDIRWNTIGQPVRSFVDITLQANFTDIQTIRARYERLSQLRRKAEQKPSSR
jgi:hypothetical protein